MIKIIPLAQGLFTIVDADDFDILSQYKWQLKKPTKGRTTYYTFCVTPSKNGKRKSIFMHRLLMDAKSGQLVDHINGNGLDNRKSNLRIATQSQNSANSKLPITNTSGFKGVSWCKRSRKWMASIRINKLKKTLGYFTDPIVAAKAYDVAAKSHFKTFARVNFPW